MQVMLIGTTDRQLEELVRPLGFKTASKDVEELGALAHPSAPQPEAIVLDLRDGAGLPAAAIQALKRQHPSTGLVLVLPKLDPAHLVEAMRAGVNEVVADPVSQADLKAALARVVETRPVAAATGDVFAFLGAKGGVGTTTVAVNVATALAKLPGATTLLVDLHLAYGDAALFMGAEPRFSVVDALENTHRLDEAFLKGLVVKTKGGSDLLASSERAVVAPIDVARIRTLVEFAARHYKYVVLDVPRSDTAMLDALELAHTITVVANQELATVRSAGRMAATLRQRYGKDRVTVVVSRYDTESDIAQGDVERVVGDRVHHLFPSNYRLAVESLNKGRPLVIQNHNGLATSLIGFARSLARVAPPKDDAQKSGSLLGLFTGRRK
jgi:pilus assembly protein CpaE